jgi:2-polyprenyl-6-methoxyphenol hydroxylase-like FAD-dependent oxidoreductase
VGCDSDGTRAILTLAGGEHVTGDVLVGADGARSAMRRALHGGEAPPRASGLFALRGVAFGVEAQLGGVTGAQYFGRGIEAGLSRASATAVYWYLSLPAADVGGDRDPRRIIRRCTRGYDPRLLAVLEATRDEDLRLDQLFERDPIAAWGRGPVTLVGDAAHPMLPHAGQGAAQALEDAAVLGHVLSDAGAVEADRAGAIDVAARLRRYERVRAPRTATIVRLARRNARMTSVRGALGCWMRDMVIRTIPERALVNAYAGLNRPIDLSHVP